MGLFDTATAPLRGVQRIGGWAATRGMGALRTLRSRGAGAVQQRRSTEAKSLDDITIARKVETEIFRSRTVDKGAIDVNVVDGVVWLRGTAKNPAQVRSLEAKARAIPEVADVQNLLHLPKTPAPTRSDAPATQRRTRSKKEPPSKPRTESRSLNADKSSERAEDSPETLAKTRTGRQPAPLGSQEPAGETSSAPTPAEQTRFERTPDTGTEKSPESGIGTSSGPDAGSGEVVH